MLKRLSSQILKVIDEWKKGCTCAPVSKPEQCHECTRAALEAIESICRGRVIGGTAIILAKVETEYGQDKPNNGNRLFSY